MKMRQKVTKNDIFKEDVHHLKEIANKLQKTMDKLTQYTAWSLSRATLWSGYMHKERKMHEHHSILYSKKQ